MKKFVFALGLLLAACQAARAEIIYQAVGNYGTVNLSGNNIRALGDAITFGGTGRNLVSVEIPVRQYYNGAETNTGSLNLELFQDNGSGLPGAAIATSTTAVFFTPQGGGSQDTVATFLFPLTLVPNNLVFMVAQNDLNPNIALFINGGIEQVGSSDDNLIDQSPNAPASPYFNNPGFGNVEVNAFNAVPEPSTIVLAGLGGVAIVFAARRRKS